MLDSTFVGQHAATVGLAMMLSACHILACRTGAHETCAGRMNRQPRHSTCPEHMHQQLVQRVGPYWRQVEWQNPLQRQQVLFCQSTLQQLDCTSRLIGDGIACFPVNTLVRQAQKLLSILCNQASFERAQHLELLLFGWVPSSPDSIRSPRYSGYIHWLMAEQAVLHYGRVRSARCLAIDTLFWGSRSPEAGIICLQP